MMLDLSVLGFPVVTIMVGPVSVCTIESFGTRKEYKAVIEMSMPRYIDVGTPY